jgi:general secretion pathway protein B
MSFILDALRKSETKRRHSEAPDLFATMPTAVEPSRARATWPRWAIGIVGGLSLLAALWLFSQRTSAPQATPVASETVAETDPPAPMPVPARTPSPAAPTPEPARSVAVAAPPIAPTVAPPADSTPSASARAPENAAAPSRPPEPVSAPSAAQTLPSAPPSGDQPVSLADLDPAMRRQLPPLKLSMHLWNETAAQRFVILDGQRLKEGDALGEILVERIDRNGAVLIWRGTRLKIELR